MANFCSDCGFHLRGAEKFCGSCGKPVVNLCPTCGQEWNQVKVAPTPGQVHTETPTPTGTFAETSARVQPVYGETFIEGKDCPNCGAKGMANKNCTLCESEN